MVVAGVVVAGLGGCGSTPTTGADVPVSPDRTTSQAASATPGPVTSASPRASAAHTPQRSTTEALEALAKARVFLGHQSVGENILAGLSAASADVDVDLRLVDARVPQATPGPVFQHAHIGVNGDPLGKIADFASIMDALDSSVDVALMKLCYIDITAATDVDAVFAEYARTMDALQQSHPSVTFIYTTAPLMSDDAARPVDASQLADVTGRAAASNGMARERFNTLVRQKYGTTGRLFDIAARESETDEGKVMAVTSEGLTYRVLDPALTSDGGHLNEAGSRKLALVLADLIADVVA